MTNITINDSIVIGLRNKLERRKGQRDRIERDIKHFTQKIDEGKRSLRYHVKAREVIRQVGLKTQRQLSYNISEITTMALNAVLDDPYDLELEFVERRNKTECDIWLTRRDRRTSADPDDGFVGGGAIDIAAFALRVASWSMQRPRSRNVLILDEPFKHLKGEHINRKMLEMLREVSRRLGVQIIMVSDERVSRAATVEATDRLFETGIRDGVTYVNVE